MPDLRLFLLTSALLTIAPGPDNLYVLTRGIAQGRIAALAAALGFTSGLIGHTLLAVFGLAAVIRSSELLFSLIKLAGAAYLIYLGFKTLKHRASLLPGAPSDTITLRRVYWQSVVANLLNPKVSLFFLSFLPQFINPGSGHAELQMAFLGGTFMVQTLVIFGLIALFSGTLGNWLRTRPSFGRYLNGVAGATFIGLGLRLATTKRGL
jgi:threonine/homoserine/homoserine lactone efflux protein